MDSRFRGNDGHKQTLLVSPAEAGVDALYKDWIPSFDGNDGEGRHNGGINDKRPCDCRCER